MLGDNQFEFDANLREALRRQLADEGYDGNDYINIDAIDPDFYSLGHVWCR